jgi:regulator of cell morphogenesis and NO signaling
MPLLEHLEHAWSAVSRVRHALRTPRRVEGVVVVSVGALRVGGVGKSVVARSVAQALGDLGVSAGIVLRGHRGTARGPLRVLPTMAPSMVGDEALEHVREGYPVWIGARRSLAVEGARAAGLAAVVLDDGFQHHGLARDLELVLVTALDAHASVLPAGPLREPRSALARADLLLTTDPEPFALDGRTVERVAVGARGLRDEGGALEPTARWIERRARLVTGIARAERVAALLGSLGIVVTEHWQYPDHGPIPSSAWTTPGPDLVVTTAKDAARSAPWRALLGPPRRVLAVQASLPSAVHRALQGVLRMRSAQFARGVVGAYPPRREHQEFPGERAGPDLALDPSMSAPTWAQESVGLLANTLPHAAGIFERCGIDYCCAGDVTLRVACARSGVSLEEVLGLLEARQEVRDPTFTDWTREPTPRVVEHLLESHHRYTREALRRATELLARVRAAHQARHPELEELQRVFDALTAELVPHLDREEQVLFPALLAWDRDPSAPPPAGTLEGVVRGMVSEHDNVGALLTRMYTLTRGYALPADACGRFAALYELLQGLQADLHRHIALESEVLFRRVLGAATQW